MPSGTIAIDGPAASGKSAVGAAVASALGLPFIDTGGIYRALTWLALSRHVSLSDETALIRLAANTGVRLEPPANEGGPQRVIIDGLDATSHLRDDDVEKNVSTVSAVAGVRQHLIQIQQALAEDGAVMAGRDIGSVVLPGAELKVYLDASPEERARRRVTQLRERGEPADYETLVEDMRRRDHLDSTREVAPLAVADGAVHLMTDSLSLSDVVSQILRLWRERSVREDAEACGEDRG
jgi:CMP/dCMP kinase